MHSDCDAWKSEHLRAINGPQTLERFLRRAVRTDHDNIRLLKIDNRLAADTACRKVVKRLVFSAAKKDGNELSSIRYFGNRT